MDLDQLWPAQAGACTEVPLGPQQRAASPGTQTGQCFLGRVPPSPTPPTQHLIIQVCNRSLQKMVDLPTTGKSEGICVRNCVREHDTKWFPYEADRPVFLLSRSPDNRSPCGAPGSGRGSLEILHLSRSPPSFVDTACSPPTHSFPEA